MELTFKQWCELNGRRHIGASNFAEFERNAKDYEAHLKKSNLEQQRQDLIGMLEVVEKRQLLQTALESLDSE